MALNDTEDLKDVGQQQKQNAITGPFPGVFLVRPGSLQLMGSILHERMSSLHVGESNSKRLTYVLLVSY